MRLGKGELQPIDLTKNEARSHYILALLRVARPIIGALRDDVVNARDQDAALGVWAERYSLTDPWHMEWVRKTLRRWATSPENAERLYVPFPSESWWALPEQRFTFEAPGWNDPSVLSRTQIEERLRDLFERELAAFLDAREREARAAAWVEPPEKRSRKVSPETHFEWAVLHRVYGMSAGDILRRDDWNGEPVDEANIKQRIAEIERLVT